MKTKNRILFCFVVTIISVGSLSDAATTSKIKPSQPPLSSNDGDESTEFDVTTVESVDKDLPSSVNVTDDPSSNSHSSTASTTDLSPTSSNTGNEDDDYDNDGDDDNSTKVEDLVNKEEEEEHNDGEGADEDETKNVEDESDDYYTENHGENDDDEDDDEEGDYEEERCTLKSFLSTMNITEMFPEDRSALTLEYESFVDDPKRIRVAPSVNHTFQRLNRLMNWARNIASQQELRSGITNFLHHNFDLFLELDLGSTCLNAVIAILVAIRRSELWALKFFDSAPKLPSGVLTGIGSYLGNFDQCISIENPSSSAETYTGQYCIIKPLLPLPETAAQSTEVDDEQTNQEKMTDQTERILNFYSHYNVENYLKTNPVLKFVEIMKSNKGRVTNFAICLPDACTAEQLESSLNKFLYPIIGIPLEIQESSCWTMQKTQDYTLYLDGYAKFALLVIGILAIIVLSATLYELYPWFFNCTYYRDESIVKPSSSSTSIKNRSVSMSALQYMVSIFSAVGNSRQLFCTSPDRLMIFDTLRLLIIILIGLSNAFYHTPLTQALHNISHSVPHELVSSARYFFIRAPSLLNDGLLITAGALFVRSIFRHLIHHHDTLTYLLYIIQRWIRLTFPVFGSILFLYLLPSTGYGPLWYRLVEILMPACTSPSSLASTIFHYSNWNFVKSNYTNDEAYVVCNPDTWFVSIIFQLNLAFFMIVLLMYQSPKKGLRFLIILIIASILFNISPRLFFQNTRTYYELMKQPSLWHVRRSFYLYHQNIIQYIGSFCVGLLLGYAIIVNENITKDPKSNNHERNQKKTLIYNILAMFGLIFPFIWVNQFFKHDQSPNELSVLLFFSIGRFIFSLSFAWIIYVCVSKKSPLLHSFLTPKSIQPVARLSFAIFLVQPLVQYHRMYSVKETYVMTFRGTIEHYCCDLIISVGLAYLLFVLFEAPASRISKLFSGNHFSSTSSSSDVSGLHHHHSHNNKRRNNFDSEQNNYWCDSPSEKMNGSSLDVSDNGCGTTFKSSSINNRIDQNCKDDSYEQNGIISIRF